MTQPPMSQPPNPAPRKEKIMTTATQCACWETCQYDAEPDSDMCAECIAEGCPGGRGGDDGCE